MNRIKKDDEVIVIAGKDKGKRGKVLQVIVNPNRGKSALARKKNARVRYLVEELNMVKKHVRPNPDKGERGGIKEQEAPIDGSNVMLYNDATGKGDRVGFRVLEDGTKVRYFKSNGEVVDI